MRRTYHTSTITNYRIPRSVRVRNLSGSRGAKSRDCVLLSLSCEQPTYSYNAMTSKVRSLHHLLTHWSSPFHQKVTVSRLLDTRIQAQNIKSKTPEDEKKIDRPKDRTIYLPNLPNVNDHQRFPSKQQGNYFP